MDNRVELVSPDGKCTILAHPSKVDEMKSNGWREPSETINILNDDDEGQNDGR